MRGFFKNGNNEHKNDFLCENLKIKTFLKAILENIYTESSGEALHFKRHRKYNIISIKNNLFNHNIQPKYCYKNISIENIDFTVRLLIRISII